MFEVICLIVGIVGLTLATVFGYHWYKSYKRLELLEVLYDNVVKANVRNVSANELLILENRLLNLKINESK